MRAIRRTAISGGAAVALLLGAAAPALAAEPSKPAITAPRGTLVHGATEVVATISSNGTTLTSAKATIKRSGGSAVVVSATPSGTMRFPVALPLNGTYTAEVAVDWREERFLLEDRTGTATSALHTFDVAVPPAEPSGVTASVDEASRTVTVTWEKNGEADMRRYEVRRSHNGGDFTTVGAVDHPEASFEDATTAGAGGDYRYIVVAYRAGLDSAVASQVESDPSPPSTAKVPDPPPPPTTAPPAAAGPAAAAPGAAAPGTATTAPGSKPGGVATSGKVDLSGFANVKAGTPRPVTPRTVPLPDPGFQGTLPFDVSGAGEGDAEAVEEGDTGELADSPGFRELGDEEESGDRQRSLALFAGGLLATVLLMHVLWVKGEVKRMPLEVVPPEGPPPAGPDGDSGSRRSRAARVRPGRPKRAASPDWFVPELGVDDGADRAVAPERKAS